MIGGNTTATDAAYLSEYFQTDGLKTSVACVPCTISGGMKNNFVVSFIRSALCIFLHACTYSVCAVYFHFAALYFGLVSNDGERSSKA